MNTFEIGKSYTINDLSNHIYNNAKIVAFDENFIKFNYNNNGVIHSKILNQKVVSNAEILTKDNKKEYWYWGLFEDKYFGAPRYGIKKAELSDEEKELNIEAGIALIENKKFAKELLFSNATSGQYKSEYFVFEDDNCALYQKSTGEWAGKLASELSEYFGD